MAATLAIGAALAPRSRRLAARVELAFRDPRAYLRAHARRAADRGIEAPIASLPWIALIDALIEARACVEIDWKSDAETVAWAIGKLRAAPRGACAWMKQDRELADRSTWELLELAGGKLVARGLTLASLDMDADNYCLVVLAPDVAAQVARLARQAGYGGLDRFTGTKLAAARKARVAAVAKHRREAARRAPALKCRIFVRGVGAARERYTITRARLACLLGYQDAESNIHASHGFQRPAACATFARREMARRKAEGYRLVKDEPAIHHVAYIGWVGPFPEDALYLLEPGGLVNAFALRGTVLWKTRATIGRGFAERSEFTHYDTAEAASRALQAELDSRTPRYGFRPIARAALLKRYRAKGASAARVPPSLSPLPG